MRAPAIPSIIYIYNHLTIPPFNFCYYFAINQSLNSLLRSLSLSLCDSLFADMEIVGPLAVLVMVCCTLLWRRSADRLLLLQDFQVSHESLYLVLDIQPRSSLARVGSEVSSRFGFTVIDTARTKIFQCHIANSKASPQLMKVLFRGLVMGETMRSIAATHYVFAVTVPHHGLVLIHRFELGFGIDPRDKALKSVLQSFWAIGKQLSFGTKSNNGLVAIENETEEQNVKLESDEQNALSSFQTKVSPSYEAPKLYGFTIIMMPRIKIYKCGLAESSIPTPKLVKSLFKGLRKGQVVRSIAGSRYVFAVTVPHNGVVLVHRYGFGPEINYRHDEMLKSIVRSFRAIGRQLTLSLSNGVAFKAIQDRLLMLKEAKELSSLQMMTEPIQEEHAGFERGSSVTNAHMISTQAQVHEVFARKNFCEKYQTKQMMKMKAVEKEKDRNRREKLMKKEHQIAEARKRRDQHFNEKMRKARSVRYLTDQQLRSSSKTNAFGFSKGFRAKFELLEKIGSGGFGTVYKARFTHHNVCPAKPFVAVKIINKSELQTPCEVEGVKIEVKIMETLNGQKGMLAFHGAYEDSKNVYLVMELCEGGDLVQALNPNGFILMENETRLLIKQILTLVSVCHRNKILHRDLKMENIICAAKGDVRSIRLIDFGISDFIMPGEYVTDRAGSLGHMAPEVFDRCAGFPSDCWSVGVIAYFLLLKKFPFAKGPYFSESDVAMWRPDFSQGPDFSDRTWLLVPSEARDLVKGLLQPDPKLRLTIRDALRHKYFKGWPMVCFAQ